MTDLPQNNPLHLYHYCREIERLLPQPKLGLMMVGRGTPTFPEGSFGQNRGT